MKRVYLYARLHVTLSSLSIVNLFNENHHPLEALSEDISRILYDATFSELYKRTSLVDIEEMHSVSLEERDFEELCKEFGLLLRMIENIQLRYGALKLGKPLAAHLEYPNCLILEYPAKDTLCLS